MGRNIDGSDDLGAAVLGLVSDSGTVITQRVGRMLTGQLSASEALRMGAEKQFAFAEAMTRAGMGTLRGDFPFAIWADALMPFRQAVSANAERLVAPAPAQVDEAAAGKRGFPALSGRFSGGRGRAS